jgi:CHAT domain-containing protein
MALLERCFEAALESGLVQIRTLTAGKVTLENFQQALREHRPHLLHFVGHGTIQEEKASLVIENPQGTALLLPAAELTDLLRDTPIRLAVLNACDTGATPNNDAVTSVAGSLVAAGMPAVIGTTRVIDDEAALLFTRELYRSFTAGYSIEESVVEARKALSVEGWDWAAYALFSGLTDLSSLRIALPGKRGQ